MATIIDVLNALRSQVVTFRTLPPQHIATENIHVGNHAVVCRCVARDSGEEIALKCYPRRRRNVPEIYGVAYKPNEVGVFTLNAPLEYVDAVAMPWIDGLSLEKHFHNPNSDYRALSCAFDSMARSILLSPRAHGDIKPANIIIAPSGEMHLIDFDAAWMPGFTDRDIEVVGTAAFGHPMRLGRRFDAYIDDFPIALISTMLAAMAYRRDSFEPHLRGDNSLFNPWDVLRGEDELLNAALTIFERKRDKAHYHVARSLYGCEGRVDGLADALGEAWRL